MSVDQAITVLQSVLSAEHETGRVNSLGDLQASKMRRSTISLLWSQIQAELTPIDNGMKSLSALPPDEQISWAQNVLEMANLSFMEIDTTGTGDTSEIIRFTLSDLLGQVLWDIFIKPEKSRLTENARQANGILDNELEQASPLPEVWERMCAAVRGRYILSFNQEWDIKQLDQAAQRYTLPAISIVGECLQHRCTKYYHREYYLSLAQLCERVGHPLANVRAETRVLGQYHIVEAMAHAVTDLRPPKPSRREQTVAISTENVDDTDALGDLDAHPF